MKRMVALIGVLVLLVGSVACGKTSPDTPTNSKTTAAANGTTTQSGETTTAQGAAGDTTAESGQSATVATNGTTATAPSGHTPTQGGTTKPTTQTVTGDGVNFKGLTVLDTAKCRVHITDIDPDSASGYVMHVALENRSAKAAYYFSVDEATINGVAVGPLMAVEVGAGQKTEETIFLSDVFPKGVDIGEYTDIALDFTVNDAEDWAAAPIAQAIGRVYPKGADKASTYRRTPQEGDRVLLDTDAMTVIAVNSAENTAMKYYYSDIYFLNKTNEDVMLSLEDASINGFGIQPRFGTLLKGGCATFGKVVWMNNTLASSRIDKVEEIRFTLCAITQKELENVKDDTEEPSYLVKEVLVYRP